MDAEARIHQLEAEVAELRALVGGLRREPTRPEPGPVGHQSASRRDLLRLGGALAVGAVAGTAAASSAAATDGFSTVGSVTSTANFTQINYTGSTNGTAFLFQGGTAFAGTDAATPYRSVLGAWSTSSSTHSPTGLYAYTENADGYGVVAKNATSGVGLFALSTGGTAGVFSGGPGSLGTDGNGVTANGGTYGVSAAGNRAALRLFPLNPAPPTRVDTHAIGELEVDLNGALWVCVSGGTPGTWRKLAGPGIAGAYYAITPVRVYDSRHGGSPPTYPPAPLPSGGSVNLFAAAPHHTDGTYGTAVIPLGATAIFANITVTDTVGTGYLSVRPYGTPDTGTSAINWFGSNQKLANGLTIPYGGDRQIIVSCGGSGASTNFVIDVYGYYL